MSDQNPSNPSRKGKQTTSTPSALQSKWPFLGQPVPVRLISPEHTRLMVCEPSAFAKSLSPDPTSLEGEASDTSQATSWRKSLRGWSLSLTLWLNEWAMRLSILLSRMV